MAIRALSVLDGGRLDALQRAFDRGLNEQGPIAVAHNGNLVMARSYVRGSRTKGAIFSSISDTAVIVHLIARSTEKGFERTFVEAEYPLASSVTNPTARPRNAAAMPLPAVSAGNWDADSSG